MPRRFPRPEMAVTGLMFADGTGAESIVVDEAHARPPPVEAAPLPAISGEIEIEEPGTVSV